MGRTEGDVTGPVISQGNSFPVLGTSLSLGQCQSPPLEFPAYRSSDRASRNGGKRGWSTPFCLSSFFKQASRVASSSPSPYIPQQWSFLALLQQLSTLTAPVPRPCFPVVQRPFKNRPMPGHSLPSAKSSTEGKAFGPGPSDLAGWYPQMTTCTNYWEGCSQESQPLPKLKHWFWAFSIVAVDLPLHF